MRLVSLALIFFFGVYVGFKTEGRGLRSILEDVRSYVLETGKTEDQ